MPFSARNLRPVISRIHSASGPEFEGLVRIYSDAHPSSERKSVQALAAMVARPDYYFFVASRETSILGFAIVLCFAESDACLLEYMAVGSEMRNHGIGRLLFAEAVAQPDIATRFLLAEVDSDKLPSPSSTLNTRRKSFYRRLGCREIEGLNYRMPLVSTALPPPMDLLVYKNDLPPALSRIQLHSWLQSCYVQVYGRPQNDPAINAMLLDLPASLRLI